MRCLDPSEILLMYSQEVPIHLGREAGIGNNGVPSHDLNNH